MHNKDVSPKNNKHQSRTHSQIRKPKCNFILLSINTFIINLKAIHPHSAHSTIRSLTFCSQYHQKSNILFTVPSEV